MIREEELNQALQLLKHMQQHGPAFAEYMESVGIDPESVFLCAAEHADAINHLGAVSSPAAAAISFGAGFTLAVVVLNMEKIEE